MTFANKHLNNGIGRSALDARSLSLANYLYRENYVFCTTLPLSVNRLCKFDFDLNGCKNGEAS